MKRMLQWLAAGVVAVGMTLGSLAVVAWMNDDPSPTPHEEEHGGPRPVPVMPPPPPPTRSDTPSFEPSLADAVAPTPAPSVAAPSPAPPQLSGLAPTAGPGSLSLGMSGGGLPSMGTLPGADLPTDAVVDEREIPARPKSRPKPTYPRLAQRQGIEGFVTLRLRIDANGAVQDAVVVDADPPGVFDEAALQTARRYRFTPARRGSEAVATTLQQTIRFELQE